MYWINRLIPGVAALLAAALLVHWLAATPKADPVELRIPDVRNAYDPAHVAVDLKGVFTSGTGQPSAEGAAWPWFRGVNRDGKSAETNLNKQWGPEGLPKLWEVAVGEGYAGPAVRDGRVYLLDYDEHARTDVIRCMSLADGQDIWRRAYKVDLPRWHGCSRTVPTLSDKYIVTFGPKCHVVCCNALTGDFVWGIDLVGEYKCTVPQWYAGQCPLVDDGKVILGVGGESLLIAVEVATGKVLWKTPNPRKWQQTHVCVQIMSYEGKKTYVYCGDKGVVGVSAEDGAVLWESIEWKVPFAAVATPLVIDKDRIFFAGGYGIGAMMARLEKDGSKTVLKPLYRLKPEQFGAEEHTPVFHDGYIYGVIPGGELVCIDLDGKQQWRSGGRNRYGIGGWMMADGAFWLMADGGLLSAVEVSPTRFKKLASMQVWEEAQECWGPPAITGGKLLVRDITRLVCLDIRKK